MILLESTNLLRVINFQNLLSSDMITFRKVLSLNTLFPIKLILFIFAISPKLKLYIKSTVLLSFEFIDVSNLTK